MVGNMVCDDGGGTEDVEGLRRGGKGSQGDVRNDSDYDLSSSQGTLKY